MHWLAVLFSALWVIAMAWCAMGVRFVLRESREWERYTWWREGRCLECGYDVRATLVRCPECGSRLPAPPEDLQLN